VFLTGTDVSDAIRSPEASMAASHVSKLPEVRAMLLDLQKSLARAGDCVMDGRDIGTVVLPDARVKIFLTAPPETRARRRFDELAAKGAMVDFDTLLAEILLRDARDAGRSIAPLKPAPDAVVLDNGALSLEESVEALLDIILEKLTAG
jgi:cytidylate kinase